MSFMYGPALDVVKVILAVIIVCSVIRMVLIAQQEEADWERSYDTDAEPVPGDDVRTVHEQASSASAQPTPTMPDDLPDDAQRRHAA